MNDGKDRTVEVEIITGNKYPYGKRVNDGDKIMMDKVSGAEWVRMGWAKKTRAATKSGAPSPNKTADKKPDQVR